MERVEEMHRKHKIVRHDGTPVPYVQEVKRHLPRIETVERHVDSLTVMKVEEVYNTQEVFAHVDIPVPHLTRAEILSVMCSVQPFSALFICTVFSISI